MSDSPKVIVAAIDLHKGSNLVLKRALESAGSQGVVHVVCVSEPNIANVKPPEELDAPELTGVDAHKLKDLVDLRVADYKKAFPERPPPRAEVHTDAGDPAEKIVALAAKVDADAIIVSSHGRTGIRRLIIGSVAEKVVRLAGCTVVVARDKRHERT
jgi:nucleotide-binding universal stress UspA family protein